MNRIARCLMVILIMIVGICYSLASPPPGLALRVATIDSGVQNMCSPEAADSFWAKVDALVETGRRARETGQAVEVKEIFSEDEVNSGLEGLAAKYSDRLVALKDVKVFFRHEYVYGVASCRILGKEITVSAVPEIWLKNGNPKVRVKSLNVQGAPRFVGSVIMGIINQRIDAEYNRIQQSAIYDYFEISSIVFGYQQVTIAGIAK
jgi:hypothetical protein